MLCPPPDGRFVPTAEVSMHALNEFKSSMYDCRLPILSHYFSGKPALRRPSMIRWY
jgi:hypothetical protein